MEGLAIQSGGASKGTGLKELVTPLRSNETAKIRGRDANCCAKSYPGQIAVMEYSKDIADYRVTESIPIRPMTKTVLIVEDNELNMKLFHDLLEAHGYQTLQTRNGMEALQLARDNRPDLILMDIQLPEVSGLEVTKWLKEDDGLRAIPVVAVTAFAMKGDEERIREGGCEAYISKPISVATFLDTVRQFIGDA